MTLLEKKPVRRFIRTIQFLRGYRPLEKVSSALKASFFGSELAGWMLLSDFISPDSVIYSFGIGTDASFDVSLHAEKHVPIFAFDPTPAAIEWSMKNFIQEGIFFFPVGVASTNGIKQFYLPRDPSFVSGSMHRFKDKELMYPVELPFMRVSTISSLLGHKHIDVLKLDIEGSEYEVVVDMLRSSIFPTQLLIEYHHRLDRKIAARTKALTRLLKSFGYEIFWISPSGAEYGYVKLP